MTLTDVAGREYAIEQPPQAAREYARILLSAANVADARDRDSGRAYAESVPHRVKRSLEDRVAALESRNCTQDGR